MDKKYGGIIWTNHALSRMRERGIKQGDALVTWKRPDNSRYAKNKGAWIYHRTFGDRKIEVVAKKNEKKEWLVLSVWSRPTHLKQKRKKKTLLQKLFKKFF